MGVFIRKVVRCPDFIERNGCLRSLGRVVKWSFEVVKSANRVKGGFGQHALWILDIFKLVIKLVSRSISYRDSQKDGIAFGL